MGLEKRAIHPEALCRWLELEEPSQTLGPAPSALLHLVERALSIALVAMSFCLLAMSSALDLASAGCDFDDLTAVFLTLVRLEVLEAAVS